ncbi:Spp2/MOS2, G-patch domain [Lasallia pustulata]|uniref:Pre-mRNA-splicing factor n=1 Tax=Lasallia pustulata TaxID=136370 RepID=A0A1W5D337_9LECA|nr:Spp2/MOS2, G-patch domain [Lasallia pustulata]
MMPKSNNSNPNAPPTAMPSADSTPATTSPSSQHPKPFSLSLSSKPKASRLSTTAPLTQHTTKKRPHSSLGDSDSEDETYHAQPQQVATFDHSAGGAIGINGGEKEKAPLVIQAQKNRDWREESRRKRGRNILPAEVQAARAGKAKDGEGDVLNGGPEAYGLAFVTRDEPGAEGNADVSMTNGVEDKTVEEAQAAKTEDEEALEALMGEGKKKSNLVLPAVRTEESEGAMWNGRLTAVGIDEDDAFRTDVASRPDSASLDDYAAVPVEEFGAALLRGMGWKEGDVVGKRKDQVSKPRVVERRPALLGIGAKGVPGGVGEELGAWGKAAGGKRKVEKVVYNPVLLRNSKTGEMLTEEELKAKREDQKRGEEDWRQRRDRNLAIDEGKKAERRQRENERSHEGSRHSSSRRDRSRSPERHHGRRRVHEDNESRDRREPDRRRREKNGARHDSRSSRDNRRGRDDYDDSRRRRRQEVY